jgi:mRNA interferase YafQ
MREIIWSSQFQRDLKKLAKSGRYKVDELIRLVETLANDLPLETKHKNHPLLGQWQHYRECHIKPDWLLIYKLETGRLILARTGSHSELFG